MVRKISHSNECLTNFVTETRFNLMNRCWERKQFHRFCIEHLAESVFIPFSDTLQSLFVQIRKLKKHTIVKKYWTICDYISVVKTSCTPAEYIKIYEDTIECEKKYWTQKTMGHLLPWYSKVSERR